MRRKFGVFQNAGQIFMFLSPQAPASVSVGAVKGCTKAAVVKAPPRFAVDVLVVGEIMRFS